MRRYFNKSFIPKCSLKLSYNPIIFNSYAFCNILSKNPAEITFKNMKNIIEENPETIDNKQLFISELDNKCKNLRTVLTGIEGFKNGFSKMKQSEFENFIQHFFVEENNFKNKMNLNENIMKEEELLEKVLNDPGLKDTFIFPLKIINLRFSKKKEYRNVFNCSICNDAIKNTEYKFKFEGEVFNYSEIDIHEYECHNKEQETEFKNVIQKMFIKHICKKYPEFNYNNQISNEENILNFYRIV